MSFQSLALGIDLGTSGVRIAIINSQLDLIYTDSINYSEGLKNWQDWETSCEVLIKSIPINLKEKIAACSVDGTSGTLIACDIEGNPIQEAIPYYMNYSEEYDIFESINQKEELKSFSSIGRALHLFNKYGNNVLIRHQADWISSWLTRNWELGEEGNNLKLGWDLTSKSWPRIFNNQPWKNALPKIIPSGNLLQKINKDKANELELPENLLIIAGTTDSNAAVIAVNPSEEQAVTILGSTIVLKKFVKKPIQSLGITNHLVGGKWLSGGSSNTGGIILKRFFNDQEIKELSNQINPSLKTNIKLLPLPFKGERFPINDPNIEPVLTPRPISDSLYLHALLESLAEIEHQGWQKLCELGITPPKEIVSIGAGAKNIQWQKIRERVLKIPIKRSTKPPAMGVAMIALNAIPENQIIH